jgi:hypothetical protein
MTLATPATSLWLDDGQTVFAPTYGSLQEGFGKYLGVSKVVDLGAATIRSGHIVFNLTELKMTAPGAQEYWAIVQGSNTADFSLFVIDLTPMTSLQVLNPQIPIGFINVHDQIVYRYIRVKWIARSRGDIVSPEDHSPRIAGLVFFKPVEDVPSLALHEQITLFSVMLRYNKEVAERFGLWLFGEAWGGPFGDGRYPMSDGYGNTLYLKCPRQIEAESKDSTPLYFGAIGDGYSHKAREFFATLEALQAVYPFAKSLDQEMDYLAIQKALYTRMEINSPPMQYKCCNNDGDPQEPLIVVSGKNRGHLNGSLLDYMTFVPRVETEYVNANRNFTDDTGWYNSPVYTGASIVHATFGGGKAVMTDPFGGEGAGGFGNPFYRFGEPVTIQPGNYVIRCKGKAIKGTSYSHGNSNPPYFSVGFANNPDLEGYGPSVSGGADFSVVNEQLFEIRREIRFEEETSTYLTFTGGGYISFEITELTLTPVLLNCGLLSTRDGQPDPYPQQMLIGGFKLYGPGDHVVGAWGIRHDSFKNKDGNHTNYHDVRVSGWDAGLYFGNGAYLIEHHNVYLIGNRRGIYMPAGIDNAGENNKFFGGQMSSNGTNIANFHNGGFTFYGTACDYPEVSRGHGSFVEENKGRIEFVSVHAEGHGPKAGEPPLFRCSDQGYIIFRGGVILLSPGMSEAPIIDLDGSATELMLDKTLLYNLMTDTGEWCTPTSSGRITGSPWWGQNPNCGAIPSRAPVMDILGSAGTFEDVQGPTDYFQLTDFGIAVEGGVYARGHLAKQYNQWQSNLLSAEVVDAPDASGKCLRVRNMYSISDNERDLVFMFPVTAAGQHIFPLIQQWFPPAITDYGGPQIVFSEAHKSSALSLINGGRTAEYPGSGAPITPIPEGTSLTLGLPAEPTRMFINAAIGTASNTFARSAEALTGENYVEFRVDAISAQNGGLRVGITNQTSLSELGAAFSTSYGSPEIVSGINMGSRVRSNGVDLGFFGERINWAVGDVIGMHVSTKRRTVRFRRNSGQWTPEQKHFLDGNVYPVIGIQSEGDRLTINGGRSNFVYDPPIGAVPAEQRASEEVAASTGTMPLYRRLFWVRKIGEDEYGRPIIGKRTVFKADVTYNIPLAGAPGWEQWTPHTMYENLTRDPAQSRTIGAPIWATHLMSIIGGSGLFQHRSFYLRIQHVSRI